MSHSARTTCVAIALAHLQDEPPPLPADVPEPVRAAVNRALAKDPDARFPDVQAFAAELAPDDAARTVLLRGSADPPRSSSSTAPTAPLSTRRSRRRPAAIGDRRSDRRAVQRGRRPRARCVAGGLRAGLRVDGVPGARAVTGAHAHSDARAPRDGADAHGLDEDRARERIESRGLAFDATRQHSVRVPEGQIVSQRPRRRARLLEGDTVRVTVSAGPPPVTIPDLGGGQIDSARGRLTERGLNVETHEVVSAREAGTTIRSEPPSGDEVSPGSTVTLVVARAKQWRTVGTYMLDSDGSTPSFRVRGQAWRITYTATELSCPYDGYVDCDGPNMTIDQTDGYAYESVSLSAGTHTTHGPDGPGRFRLKVSGYSGEWQVEAGRVKSRDVV